MSAVRCVVFCVIVCQALRPIGAQNVRDSAGIRIVENAKPVWRDADALRLSSAPVLRIGDPSTPELTFARIRGVFRLDGGRLLVADGGTLQLRLFDSTGRFVSASAGKGSAPGQLSSMDFVRRLRGDTIAVLSGISSLARYTGDGAFVRSVSIPQGADGRPTTLPVSLLANGTRVMIPIPQPAAHPAGARWIDSIPVRLVSDGGQVIADLGMLPYLEFEQQGASPSPPWLSPIAVFTGSTDRFFAGFGDRYDIRVYSATGTLQSIIRRAWTPTPVTAAEWERWVVEWSKLWVKSTGEQREKDIQDVRDDPYAEVLPAFSEFIVDRVDRLWVREAHLDDAIAAGSLTDIPVVPSNWSVFDTNGRWLGDVAMPANFQPYDIGADFVAGKARLNNVNSVVVYALGATGRAR
jgi:hypothetical protein